MTCSRRCFAADRGRGMIVNLSVDTSSVDLMAFAKDIDAFYIDTVVEPWPGLYTDRNRSISQRSNYALRESVLNLRRRRPGGSTAVSCCGANPAWYRGSSSRRSSTSPPRSGLSSTSRRHATTGRG